MTVVALRSGCTPSSEKDRLVERFALLVDEYTEQFGKPPVAMAAMVADTTGRNNLGWIVLDDSDGGARPLLALAGARLLNEAVT